MKTIEEELLSTRWTLPSAICKEGEGSVKTVEKKHTGLDAAAVVEWRRALHVIELRAVIFF